MENESGKSQEILIIRRGGGDDNAAHKGGAWKIAYADFVTAMMAFFLVMWLINSANEATRARVASYFNPIKMTDASPSGKGLREPITEKTSQSKTSGQMVDGGSTNPVGEASAMAESESKVKTQKEAEMMNHPFETLDELANKTKIVEGGFVAASSDKVGDPFDPQAWELLRRGAGNKSEPVAGKAEKSLGTEDQFSAATEPKSETKDANGLTVEKPADTAGEKQGEKPAEKQAERKVDPETAKHLEELKTNIEKAAALGAVPRNIKLVVTNTGDGLMISLEDAAERGMFEVGSAQPTPELVTVVSQIGGLLKGESGRIIIRGHTDARRFRNESYDNWQLSTARAHMASYMLQRGGLPEARIARIEGYGASQLLVPKDPNADANRRVEFLLSP